MNKNQNAGCVFKMFAPLIFTGIMASTIIGLIRDDRLSQKDHKDKLDRLIRGEGGAAGFLYILQQDTLEEILEDGEIDLNFSAKDPDGRIIRFKIGPDPKNNKKLIGGITYINGEEKVNIDLYDDNFNKELENIFALTNFETLTITDYNLGIRLPGENYVNFTIGDFDFFATCTLDYDIRNNLNGLKPLTYSGIRQVLIYNSDI